MNKLRLFVVAVALTLSGVFAFAFVNPVAALDPLEEVCATNPSSEICQGRAADSSNQLIAAIVNTLLFLVGILAVVMIIVGGIQYATSSGDAGRVTVAKNTITYSVVGLVVAFSAYAIINWVLKIFG